MVLRQWIGADLQDLNARCARVGEVVPGELAAGAVDYVLPHLGLSQADCGRDEEDRYGGCDVDLHDG